MMSGIGSPHGCFDSSSVLAALSCWMVAGCFALELALLLWPSPTVAKWLAAAESAMVDAWRRLAVLLTGRG
jgi:hypothetical protein